MSRVPRPRVIPTAFGGAVLLALTSCVPSGPLIEGDPVEVEFTVPDAALLTTIDEVAIDTGMAAAFDEVVAMLPDAHAVRDEFLADDRAFADALVGELGLPSSVTFAPPSGGHLARAAGALSDGETLNNVVLGGIAGNTMSNMMDQAESSGSGPGTHPDGTGTTVTIDENGDLTVEIGNDSAGSAGGASANGGFTLRLDGTYCPGPDGRFDAILQASRQVQATGAAGSASYRQEVRVEAQGVLGDNAAPEQMDVTTSQRTTRTDAAGTTTAATTAQTTDWFGGPGLDPGKNPPRKTEDSLGSDADVAKLVADGQARAAALALGLVTGLYRMWTDGMCVHIVTDAPTEVEADTTTDFTIRVVRKLSGAEVEGPLHLTLTGEESVDPTESRSTGGFHFESGEEGSSGQLEIVSTSRQGGAKRSHTFTVGPGAWQAEGGWGQFTGTGTVCDLTQPFVVGTASAFAFWSFTPGGKLDFADITGAPQSSIYGIGSWSLVYEDDKPVAIDGTVQADEIHVGGDEREFEMAPHFELTHIARPPLCEPPPG